MNPGGPVELKLTLPLLMLVALWLSAASLQRIGALPWLHGIHLLPAGTFTA